MFCFFENNTQDDCLFTDYPQDDRNSAENSSPCVVYNEAFVRDEIPLRFLPQVGGGGPTDVIIIIIRERS